MPCPAERGCILKNIIWICLGLRLPNVLVHGIRQVIVGNPERNIGIGKEIAQRVNERITDGAHRISIAARPEQWNHQVELRIPSPNSESLAKIGFRGGNLPTARNVKKAADSENAVTEEARGFLAGPFPAPLQQV